MGIRRAIISILTCVLVMLLTTMLQAQQKGDHVHHGGGPADEQSPVPQRMTMEELHQHGGVPPGWQFTLPAGDPETGRQVFIDMKCYTCHQVTGEKFPAHKRDIGDVGPDLTGMGAHHPAAYFAETILNPNAVVVLGDGYTGPDGLSRMPEYNDSLTIAQLINLVAYLKSLRSSPEQTGSHQPHGSHQPPKGHTMPGMPPHGHK